MLVRRVAGSVIHWTLVAAYLVFMVAAAALGILLAVGWMFSAPTAYFP